MKHYLPKAKMTETDDVIFRVILYNWGKRAVKEKTSLHVSSVNFRIERPETTVRNDLKQSAALLYCEK